MILKKVVLTMALMGAMVFLSMAWMIVLTLIMDDVIPAESKDSTLGVIFLVVGLPLVIGPATAIVVFGSAWGFPRIWENP